MLVRCAHDRLVDIKGLKPHPKNRNKHPEDQIARLAKILEYQGWRYPVKVSNLSGYITSGHGRLLAAKHLGWTQVPVNYQDYNSEEQEYADVQADNAIASWAELDLSGINGDIGALGPDFDIDLLGIRDFSIDPSDKEGEGDPDEIPEPAKPIVQAGELYLLGEHRLLCGDSTDPLMVSRLMNGEKADMVFTDPPYGIKRDKGFEGFEGFGGFGKPIKRRRYEDSDWDSERPTKECFDLILTLGKQAIIFGGNFFADFLPQGKHWLVWDKNNTMPTFGDCELAWTNIDRTSVKKYEFTYNGLIGKEKERFHPTQKPVALFEAIFQDYEFSSAVDPFLGSGSTLIACEKTNRRCYGMEIDPVYCGVILDRFEKFSGKKAIREDGVAWSIIKSDGKTT